MSLSMYQVSIPAFTRTLTALSAILDKAIAQTAARKIEPSALLVARLAPDMFTFTKQMQITCDFAKNTAARLAGLEPPKFTDDEKSFEDLKARIAKTLDYLKSTTAAQIDGSEDRDITFPVGGNPMTFKGLGYLVNIAMPNFYFHAAAAYAILRHNGLEIGKRDFLGAM